MSANSVMWAGWYYSHGIRVFPLKNRSKEPACKWRVYRPTDERVLAFENYGVPLGMPSETHPDIVLGVVDTDNPETEAWVSTQPLLQTPFMVKTAKGYHRYFRLRKPVDKFIHRAGLTIEFRNEGQYVVGPGSVHPSGHVYEPLDWSWEWDDIPVFSHTMFQMHDGSCGGRAATPVGVMNASGTFEDGFVIPDVIQSGERHDILFRAIRSMKARGQLTMDQAYEMILDANQGCCSPPLPPSQVDRKWFDRAWNNFDRPINITNAPISKPVAKVAQAVDAAPDSTLAQNRRRRF